MVADVLATQGASAFAMAFATMVFAMLNRIKSLPAR